VFGQRWIEPPVALGVRAIERVAAESGVDLRPGDVVLVRTGQTARRAELGPRPPDTPSVGLHPDAFGWLARKDVALLGSDGNTEARPSPVAGVDAPVHVLALVAVGMCVLDNLDLERLSAACDSAGRWDFFVVIAPLIVSAGTGSPINPIAVL
jgi:kynurenine formamidase